MRKAINKSFDSLHTMAKANFDSWLHSPRTWIMLSFVITFCFIVAGSFIRTVSNLSYKFHFTEALFYMLYNGCNITTTSILFLITVSELPRQIGFQYSMLIRSTRLRWLTSQVIYCFWMVLFMLALVVISVSFFIAPATQSGQGWSETNLILTNQILKHEALIPVFIRDNFTPFTACLYALLPMFLFWFSMVFIILLFSLMNLPLAGVLFYALMLVSNVVFMLETIGNFPMPIYFATLCNIISGSPDKEWFQLSKAFIGYVTIIITLLVAMGLRVRKSDLRFHFD